MNPVMASSKSVEWETPQKLFDEIAREFNFKLDVSATTKNKKCNLYYTKLDNGLNQSWICDGDVWMNPPYGREIKHWVKKAFVESLNGTTIVGLLPARTDTKWFHEYIYGKAEIRFLRDRIRFNGADRAPFPSMIVIWRPQ